MSLSVIIPSKRISNLMPCVSFLRRHEPGVRIIAVDDGIDWGHINGWLNYSRVDVIPGAKPFIYSRNCNLGISAAGTDDIVLLNDDALLKVECGFSIMQHQWAANPQYGLIASSLDHCGTPEQIRRGTDGLRELPVMAVFACVFIPRSTIDRVGLLDERYGVNADGQSVRGYGVEDADYSKSVRNAGLKLGVSDSCFVTHTELPSTFGHRDSRPGTRKTADVRLHERVYREKWGERPYV